MRKWGYRDVGNGLEGRVFDGSLPHGWHPSPADVGWEGSDGLRKVRDVEAVSVAQDESEQEAVDPPDFLLTTQQAIQRAGVSQPTWNRWVAQLGIEPYGREGRTLVYRSSDVNRIIEARDADRA